MRISPRNLSSCAKRTFERRMYASRTYGKTCALVNQELYSWIGLFSSGMYLIRDWQGYLVPYSVFEQQSRANLPEALGQLRERQNRVGTVRLSILLVVMCIVSDVNGFYRFKRGSVSV